MFRNTPFQSYKYKYYYRKFLKNKVSQYYYDCLYINHLYKLFLFILFQSVNIEDTSIPFKNLVIIYIKNLIIDFNEIEICFKTQHSKQLFKYVYIYRSVCFRDINKI